MVWAKLDDRMITHPKILALTDSALAAYVRSLVWSSAHLTDGFVPFTVLRLVMNGDPECVADELATPAYEGANPLWEPVEGGYQIHDFRDYQPAAAEVSARKAEISRVRAEAGRRGGLQRGRNLQAKRQAAGGEPDPWSE